MYEFLKRYERDVRAFEQKNPGGGRDEILGTDSDGRNITLRINEGFLKPLRRRVDVDMQLLILPGYGILLFRDSRLLEALDSSLLSSGVTISVLPQARREDAMRRIEELAGEGGRISLLCDTVREMSEDDPYFALYVYALEIMPEYPELLDESRCSGQLPHALVREYNTLTYIARHAAERLHMASLLRQEDDVREDVRMLCEARSTRYVSNAAERIMDGLRRSRICQEVTVSQEEAFLVQNEALPKEENVLDMR